MFDDSNQDSPTFWGDAPPIRFRGPQRPARASRDGTPGYTVRAITYQITPTAPSRFGLTWQIRNERNRRLATDKELRRERHLEQARLVAAYLGEEEPADAPANPDAGRTAFYLTNNSPEPVYAVVGGMVFVQGPAPRTLEDMMELNRRQYQRLGAVTTVSILPGGLYRVWVNGVGWSAIPGGRAGLEIAFMDRAGASWFRRANGALEELGKPVLDYFFDLGLVGPYDLQTPERVDGR